MNTSIFIQSQLVATKFFVPVAPGTLISRPRLTALLAKSLKYPLTLVSAPAGFGKTTLLAAWAQSLRASHTQVAWVSLDEEDNEPVLFWTYVLSALDTDLQERFTPLLKSLQSPQAPPLKYILTALINLLSKSCEHFLLILDDFHLITEEQIHTSLSYLVEHLPAQLHIILATRTDPPLPLPQLRARGQVLEVGTDQLRCTVEETKAFCKEVMNTQLPDETIQEVKARTEGWLVGLQLLALSRRGHADPATLLEEVSGDQRYILDFLTEEVLGRQPQDMQTFLLSTCILERLNASLCDAVMEQSGSQHMLESLEHANLFVVSLDNKRQWYRYHALFAQALQHQLEQTHADLVPILHYRASLWYAQHDQTTQAILHAFRAKEWQWMADLIERTPSLLSFTWGASEHELVLLRQWLAQLPTDVVHSRPRLSLACAQLLWTVAPSTMLQTWIGAAEATLTSSLTMQTDRDTSHPILSSQAQQERENLLGEVIASQAYLQSYQADGQTVLALCQRALSLLSPHNYMNRVLVAWAQLVAYYTSAANDAEAAIQSGQQGISLAQAAGLPTLAIISMCSTARHMIGTGRLHEAERLTQQAMLQGTELGGLVLPEWGYPAVFQAEILREWNEVDAAFSLIEEALLLCRQTKSMILLLYLLLAYAVLLRIHLSRGELDAACSALQQLKRTGMSMSQPVYIHVHGYFTTVDQIRLWLACGDLKQATRWVEKLDLKGRSGSPFAREREDVACARVYLAKKQPDVALQRLEPVLQRASIGKRWNHVLEIHLLQALAHQMHHEEMQALDALSQAARLAEPEGYIRSFVDEGAPMESLLSKLQEVQRKDGPTPYLDRVLAAFPQQNKTQKRQPKRTR